MPAVPSILRLMQVASSAKAAELLHDFLSSTRIVHTPTVTATDATSEPGLGPAPVVYGSTMGLAFTPDIDLAYRILKIPMNFVGDPSFHVHWTKSSDADESGNTVQWRLSYTVLDGADDDINVAPTVIDMTDTYDEAGTTTRIVARTPNYDAVGFVANYYLGVSLEVIGAGTTLTSEPVCISCDLLQRVTDV